MASDPSWLDGLLPGALVRTLALGGAVAWILALLSVIVVAIVLFKTVELLLARRDGGRVGHALAIWSRGGWREALDEVSTSQHGVSAIVRIAMRGRLADHPDALIREEVQRVASAHMMRLRSQLRTLEVIGQIAPLLGLFGTVLGMIEAFRRMEEAGSRIDPSVLSGGIWQALLTTGIGLAVAIPAVLLHQWLERRTDAHEHRIEDAVTRVFTSDLYAGDGSGIGTRVPGRSGLPARSAGRHAA